MKIKLLLAILTALAVLAVGCSKASPTTNKNATNSNAAPKAEAKKALPPSKVVPVVRRCFSGRNQPAQLRLRLRVITAGKGSLIQDTNGIDIVRQMLQPVFGSEDGVLP